MFLFSIQLPSKSSHIAYQQDAQNAPPRGSPTHQARGSTTEPVSQLWTHHHRTGKLCPISLLVFERFVISLHDFMQSRKTKSVWGPRQHMLKCGHARFDRVAVSFNSIATGFSQRKLEQAMQLSSPSSFWACVKSLCAFLQSRVWFSQPKPFVIQSLQPTQHSIKVCS